jgi:hypothetical protein
VRALAERGAGVNTVNKRGKTPVFVAAQWGHAETVRALAAGDADVNTADNDGCTAVYIAAQNGHAETVRALAAGGADVNTADNDGWTPIYIAAENGHAETVCALAECGADANAPSSEGYTPLHAAAQRGDAAMAWTLVRKGRAGLSRARQQRLALALAQYPRLRRASRAGDWLLNMVLFPAHRPSEMAAQGRHVTAERVLKFLEAQEGAAPTHAAANAARRADFECPVCLESAVEALVLVPCGHPICGGCWTDIEPRDGSCPLCRGGERLAAASATWPPTVLLRERFCVQMPQ